MRISWLSADEIARARTALGAGGATWDDHFAPGFITPPAPPEAHAADWAHLTEHVARAERVSAAVRTAGLIGARARFAGSGFAIEAATLAAAAHEDGTLELPEIEGVLGCAIDSYVFYAPFLELLVERGRDQPDRILAAYEGFTAAHTAALAHAPESAARIGAVQDALADIYVTLGRLDQAEALFTRRHEEDRGDVAVALSASRAFLAHGALGKAVHWLGVAANRADGLGRADFAGKLRTKQDAIRRRLS
jgi:hypothetical protein